MKNKNSGNHPEKHFRFGGVRATVWKDVRQSPAGYDFESRSVSLDRAYKDAGGEWKSTSNLKENDVPKAITALQKAFEYMTKRETGQAGAREVEEDETVEVEKVE